MEKNLIRINLRGGMLPIGKLSNILNACEALQLDTIHLGARQDVLLHTTEKNTEVLSRHFGTPKIDFEVNRNEFPNIISSYIAEDIFSTHPWVSESMYQDILNSFEYTTRLKINIVDPSQGIVPLFTGNLNFICSSHLNFWHLYIKHPHVDGMVSYPYLIYSSEVGALSQVLEEALLNNKMVDINQLAKAFNEKHRFIVMPVDQELMLQRIRFPYYEGIHKIVDKFLLGIYRRNNDFSVDFLKTVVELCNQTRIGQLFITPWQSFIVKGIEENDRIQWEKLLGKFGINIRHSALELNWQVPDLDEQALALKKFLVREFDERDIRTYGLSFAVKTNAMDIAASVVIEEKYSRVGTEVKAEYYTVLFSEDFNPNKQVYTVYSDNVQKEDLPDVLERLSRKYYEQLNNLKEFMMVEDRSDKKKTSVKVVHQCKHCFSYYDPEYGDPGNNISVGILFSELPDSYLCAVCDAPKSDYEEKEMVLELE